MASSYFGWILRRGTKLECWQPLFFPFLWRMPFSLTQVSSEPGQAGLYRSNRKYSGYQGFPFSQCTPCVEEQGRTEGRKDRSPITLPPRDNNFSDHFPALPPHNIPQTLLTPSHLAPRPRWAVSVLCFVLWRDTQPNLCASPAPYSPQKTKTLKYAACLVECISGMSSLGKEQRLSSPEATLSGLDPGGHRDLECPEFALVCP